MSQNKSFTTGVKRGLRRELSGPAPETLADPVTIDLDADQPGGRSITFAGPGATQMMLLAAAAQNSNDMAAVSDALSILFNLIDEPSEARYLKARLMDRRDPLEIDTILSIIEYVVGEWSAHPTESPSGSSGSPSSSGTGSTGKRRARASTS